MNGNGYHAVSQVPWCESAPDSVSVVKVTTPEMLKECWPYVKKRLQIIKKKDKAAGNWVPEHARLAVIQGMAKPPTSMAELFLLPDQTGHIHGFIITVIRADPYYNLPWTLYIWLGWLNRDLMDRFIPWLRNLASERGLKAIEFESGRFGWMGSVGKLKIPFKLKHSTYRMEID